MVTIQISELAIMAARIVGVICWIYAVYPLTKSGLKLNPLVLGAVLIFGSSALQPAPAPAPPPTPGPTPGTPFAQQIRATFDGTEAEAQILAALHTQMAESLRYDGEQAKPLITNTTQMGQMFAQLQRYRAGANSPWGERFPAMKTAIATEARSRGVIGQGSQPLDRAKRDSAVDFYNEVGSIFSSLRQLP